MAGSALPPTPLMTYPARVHQDAYAFGSAVQAEALARQIQAAQSHHFQHKAPVYRSQSTTSFSSGHHDHHHNHHHNQHNSQHNHHSGPFDFGPTQESLPRHLSKFHEDAIATAYVKVEPVHLRQTDFESTQHEPEERPTYEVPVKSSVVRRQPTKVRGQCSGVRYL